MNADDIVVDEIRRKAVDKAAGKNGRMLNNSVIPIVVCGPPGSGKSTFVKERMKRGDLLVDMDELYRALSGLELRDKPDCLLPFVAEARDALIARIPRGARGVRRAWVVTSSPDLQYIRDLLRKLRAEVHVLDVPTRECVKRMKAEGRDAEHVNLMRQRCDEWRKGWGR
jgi:predicted kinase